MSMEAHLAELKRRHRALEAEIVEARAHPSIDDLQIVELKRRKLLVKDEIARLQLSSQTIVFDLMSLSRSVENFSRTTPVPQKAQVV
jgi:hypothetical protein